MEIKIKKIFNFFAIIINIVLQPNKLYSYYYWLIDSRSVVILSMFPPSTFSTTQQSISEVLTEVWNMIDIDKMTEEVRGVCDTERTSRSSKE
jgi:hypothetical protein